jgi:hypothetical protein
VIEAVTPLPWMTQGGGATPVWTAPGQVMTTEGVGQTGQSTVVTTKPGGMTPGVHFEGLPVQVSEMV